jgi:Ser/Thr protein kinase RdoA (MazF antagonist)
MLSAVLHSFGFIENSYEVAQFGSGLINNTWVVERSGKKYILQRINQNVFKTPEDIDENITNIATYLKEHYPAYMFTVPLSTTDGKTLLLYQDGAFRIFEFIEGSHSYDTLQQPEQAYEAAKQFGVFTKLLGGFDALQLKVTLPHFHDLSLRYRQFEQTVAQGNKERITHASSLIELVEGYAGIVTTFDKIEHNPAFKKRVTHHDTKISNVLFDEHDKGICVIDLDTVMPGFFISDVGDMMRTYLAKASEEETDFGKIAIRDEYFDAIVEGYLGEMRFELCEQELDAFAYSGKFMIYMQALRFLTDYLNNDVYYGAKYPLHNFNRAANQMVLLEDLVSKEGLFNQKVRDFVNR